MPTLANRRSPPPQPRDLAVVILVLVITTLLYLLLHRSLDHLHHQLSSLPPMRSNVAANQ